MRRAMEAFGRVVESVIERTKQARRQVTARSGMQPVLSIENMLPTSRIRDVIEATTIKVLGNALPDLKGRSVLEVGEGPACLAARLLAAQAQFVVGVEIGGGSVGQQGDVSRGFVVRGNIAKLPFADNRYYYFFARLATQFQGDMSRTLRELSRIITPGGQGTVIDYHPFGLYARRGLNRVRPLDLGVQRLEDYYHVCRQAGLRIVNVREAFVDEGMRQLFKEDEIQVYRNLKGTPLLIFLFVYKPKGA